MDGPYIQTSKELLNPPHIVITRYRNDYKKKTRSKHNVNRCGIPGGLSTLDWTGEKSKRLGKLKRTINETSLGFTIWYLKRAISIKQEKNKSERGIMKESGELGPRMNIFYVQMDSSLMHTMIFPKKFAKMFKGSKSKNIELKGPSGIAWHVKMIRFNDTFALQSGWKEFVRANKIYDDDMLVFTYKSNFSFKVIIFDRSGCQKAAPFFAKKTESEESNDSLILEVKKEIISLSSGSSSTDESSTEISTRTTRARTAGKRICGKRKQRVFAQESSESESESDKVEHETVKKRKTRENNRAKKDSCLYVVSRNTYLTKAQEEVANRMTRKTQKGSYSFVKILTHTETCIHQYCRLNLPSGFACKVLQSEKKKITLLFADLDKRSNICTASYSKTKTSRSISPGWREFASKNRLKKGNLCLFELRKQDKRGSLTMVVHLIG